MIYLRTLGESVIEVGEARIGPSAPHMFAALLYLALEAGRRVPRARLQELLFPTSDERKGSHSLRQLLYRLRRLGVELEGGASWVMIRSATVAADFQPFLRPSSDLRSDLGRMAGGLLPGFNASFSAPFADWFDARRAELHAKIRRTLALELLEHRRLARWPAAEQTARALLAVDPYNEEGTLALAETMALAGSKVDAVRLLDSYLEEVGSRDASLRLPAALLSKRIAQDLPGIPGPGAAAMVGRGSSLAVLRELLRRANAGDGSACHVFGEAGIGKTRLVGEFVRIAILDGARVEHVRSQPHDARRPMGAFCDLVPALLKLRGALGCSPEAMSFLTRLFRFDHDSVGPFSADVREAELLSARITRAISELLDALTAESTLVLVLDDAHWLDEISLQVVADLIAERKHRRLLLLLTSREVHLHTAISQTQRLKSVQLGPLAHHDARSLLTELLTVGGCDPDEKLLVWALGVAAGNPFFLHSLAAHYIATHDRYGIPEPLSDLLTERLSLLDRRSRRVFEVCSILGRQATFERLEAVMELPRHGLLDSLEALEQHGFITSDGQQIASTHTLLSEIALRRTPLAVRRLLHRAAANALQSEAVENVSPATLWDCAEHWVQAGDGRRSMDALRACARHAIGIGQPYQAVEALERANRLASGDVDRVPLLRELVDAAQIAGDWHVALEALKVLNPILANTPRLHPLRATYEVAEFEALWGSGVDRVQLGERLRAYLRQDCLAPTDRLRACTILAAVAEEVLSAQLASEAYEASRVVIATGADLQACVFDVIYHASFGSLSIATEAARRAIEMSKAESNRAAGCRTALIAGYALLRAGLLEEGFVALQQVYHEATCNGLHSLRRRAASCLASFLRDAGRLTEAREWHEIEKAIFHGGRAREWSGTFFSNCVLFAVDAGEFEVAHEVIARALRAPPAVFGEHAALHFKALTLRVQQLADGRQCSDRELEDLLAMHMSFRGLGHHDEVMETLWHALASRGRVGEADELLRQYLTQHRRLRSPLSPGVRSLGQRVQIAGEPRQFGPTPLSDVARLEARRM